MRNQPHNTAKEPARTNTAISVSTAAAAAKKVPRTRPTHASLVR
jgi:hypothetical protein